MNKGEKHIMNELAEIDRGSALPYYCQLEQILRRLISSGELHPGAQLPSEFELVARYGISRTTARQAITQLCHEGLAERIKGKGTFVTASSPRERKRQIGFLQYTASSSPAYYALMMKGVEEIATDAESHLVCATGGPFTPRTPLPAMIGEAVVDGVVLTGVIRPALLKALARTGIPHVVIGSIEADGTTPLVTWDGEMAIRRAVELLTSLGHRRIALLNGSPGIQIHGKYRDGYKAICADGQTAQLLPLYAEAQGSSKADGFDEMARILASEPERPTAVICGNDYLAWGAMEAAREFNLAVPHDISIMGIGDIELSALLSPALTTVRIPLLELGREAARFLFDIMDGGHPTQSVRNIPFDITVRDSTSTCSDRSPQGNTKLQQSTR